jgi:hypothetical protein
MKEDDVRFKPVNEFSKSPNAVNISSKSGRIYLPGYIMGIPPIVDSQMMDIVDL